jgi:hypothetical protein
MEQEQGDEHESIVKDTEQEQKDEHESMRLTCGDVSCDRFRLSAFSRAAVDSARTCADMAVAAE